MLEALDIYSGSGTSLGALGAAFGRNRDQSVVDRTEAIRKKTGVDSQEELEAKVRGVAEDFTSIFMNQIMKSMRNTVQENPAMHGDNGEKFFQEMLDTEQSKTLARGSGYGLTDLVYQALMSNVQVGQVPQEQRHGEFNAEEDIEAGQELVVDAVEA